METNVSIYSLFGTLKSIFELMQSKQSLKEKFDIATIAKASKHTNQTQLMLDLEILTELQLLIYESHADCYDTQNVKCDSWSITGTGCLMILNNFRTLVIPK